jgi:hypothetical protein
VGGGLSSNIEDVRGVASATGDRRVGLERRSCERGETRGRRAYVRREEEE